MSKKKEYRYYEADFETTTGVYSMDNTQVWLYYIENIFDEYDNSLGLNIESFFEFLETFDKDTMVYFHNLNWDGEFLLNFLAEHYTYKKQPVGQFAPKLEHGEWNNMSDGVSSHYVIQFKTKSRNVRIKFLCSYKQLMSSVSNLSGVFEKEKIDYDVKKLYHSIADVPKKVIKYVKKDVKTVIPYMASLIEQYQNNIGITSSGTAMKLVKQKLTKDTFESFFKNQVQVGEIGKDGVYKNGEWDYYKKYYLGGWTYLKADTAKKILTNINVYDVNSLYPYIMRNFKLPVGAALECKKKKCGHLRLLEINADFKIKPFGVPFIPDKTGYSQHIDYLSEAKNHVMFLTEEMWDLVKEMYDVSYYKIIKETHFMGIKEIFTDYIDEYQAMKQHSRKGSFEYLFAKLMQNQVYGKFGMSPLRKKYFFRDYDPDLDTRKDVVIYGKEHKMVLDYDWDLTDPSYIPMAIWITSLAKIITIKAANIANKLCQCIRPCGAFNYSDTDSIHLSICDYHKAILETLIEVHPTKLGAWDNETVARYGWYLKRKFYIEFDKVSNHVDPNHSGMAGVNKYNAVRWTNCQIISGVWTATKLQKRKINGGVILLEKEVDLHVNTPETNTGYQVFWLQETSRSGQRKKTKRVLRGSKSRKNN